MSEFKGYMIYFSMKIQSFLDLLEHIPQSDLGIRPWRLAGSAPGERAEEETCRRSRANSPGRLRAAGRSVRCGNGAPGEQGSVGTTDR